ncbi:hypothetical protein ANCCAN_24608 [Ancylostoma caninum]|uniref:Uncharacterized protein n=1 Tax=Ancylostoma caninum TaxID=29170 RepID=A0A368FBS9_ANCCA|nr:hypothetical protein ANCCAN_24608 [Ancylostoma caninum]
MSMSTRVIETKVCYPVTQKKELGYLVKVVPLGQFDADEQTFWWHDLNTYYLVPKSLRITNVSALGTIVDIDNCHRLSSVHLCEFTTQCSGCRLDRHERSSCSVVKHNTMNDEFTLIRPILRTTITATLCTRMLYQDAPGTDFNVKAVNDPIFVVEIPSAGVLQIGNNTVRSRVTSNNFLVDMIVTVPSFSFISCTVEAYNCNHEVFQ